MILKAFSNLITRPFMTIDPISVATVALPALGGFFSEIGEGKRHREEMEQERKELEEQRRQFGLSLGQRQKEFNRTAGMQGLDFLASQRAQAGKQARTRSFRNDFIAAIGGV